MEVEKKKEKQQSARNIKNIKTPCCNPFLIICYELLLPIFIIDEKYPPNGTNLDMIVGLLSENSCAVVNKSWTLI